MGFKLLIKLCGSISMILTPTAFIIVIMGHFPFSIYKEYVVCLPVKYPFISIASAQSVNGNHFNTEALCDAPLIFNNRCNIFIKHVINLWVSPFFVFNWVLFSKFFVSP